MSDNDYYSDSDSENSSENEEIVIPSSRKPLFKPTESIKKHNVDFDEVDDSEPDDIEHEESDEDENIVGGADSDTELEEGEIRDDDPDGDGDDAEVEPESDEDDDEDIEINEDGEPIEKTQAVKVSKTTKVKKLQLPIDDDEDDDDDEYDENYLQKFDNDVVKNYVNDFHPECLNHNYDEIAKLSVVTRNYDGIIIDPLHRTIPYLTKYEKARILGQRAKQIETGAKPLVKVPENIVDSYIIAELELREKKIPFIIRRPIPGGGCEYWNLRDLEIIAF